MLCISTFNRYFREIFIIIIFIFIFLERKLLDSVWLNLYVLREDLGNDFIG